MIMMDSALVRENPRSDLTIVCLKLTSDIKTPADYIQIRHCLILS